MEEIQVTLEPQDNNRLSNLCGPLNDNIKILENLLDVKINQRGNLFHFIGKKESVEKASAMIKKLYIDSENSVITKDEISKNFDINNNYNNKKNSQKYTHSNIVIKNFSIATKSENQRRYINAISDKDLVFSVGSAGSGKTFLAIAMALFYFEKEMVKKIHLVRPAIEAGENLGFLPGDLQQKIDPYLRPMYDALEEIVGADYTNSLIDKNIIEISPLAFMRGRTLKNSFIILDEAQNTTIEQMKMFLTRIGHGSKVVVTGDITQIDLKKGVKSGLADILTKVKNIEEISICELFEADVIRHPIVKKIINAYKRI
jgi:phosphate starvation-inducible PhoH-like protein|tara:strand:- start:27 stop:971 length:945 start_codon:yes stop_codon:yes gene_type:complete